MIITSLPPLGLTAPLTGPAQIKSYVETNSNYNITCDDMNLKLWYFVTENNITGFNKNYNEFLLSDLVWENEIEFEKFYNRIEPFVLDYIKYLLKFDIIGFSVLSYRSKFILIKMCQLIKNIDTNKRIVLGGPYTQWIAKELIEEKLIDSFNVGDSEQYMLNFLNGDSKISYELYQNLNYDILPPPNYDDYDFGLYPSVPFDPTIDNLGAKYLHIYASKGCVRKCKFCTVASMTPKFVFKNGKQIADEMIHLQQRYSFKEFFFVDSLINGSNKFLNEMCDQLIITYKKLNLKPKSWRCNAIIRPQLRFGEEYYKKMSDSGCSALMYGIESGSERIRDLMNKKGTTNDDIYKTFEWCAKYNIKFGLNFIIGYPGETETDFEETNMFIKSLSAYVDNNHLHRVCIYIANPVISTAIHNEVTFDEQYSMSLPSALRSIIWTDDIGTDYQERYRRYKIAVETANKIGMDVSDVFQDTYEDIFQKINF